jgi:hypothetical protein
MTKTPKLEKQQERLKKILILAIKNNNSIHTEKGKRGTMTLRFKGSFFIESIKLSRAEYKHFERMILEYLLPF